MTDTGGEEHLVCGSHRGLFENGVRTEKVQMTGEELAGKGLTSALWGLAMPLVGGVAFFLGQSVSFTLAAALLTAVAAPILLALGLIMGLIALSRLPRGAAGRGRAAIAVCIPLVFVVAWIVLAQFY